MLCCELGKDENVKINSSEFHCLYINSKSFGRVRFTTHMATAGYFHPLRSDIFMPMRVLGIRHLEGYCCLLDYRDFRLHSTWIVMLFNGCVQSATFGVKKRIFLIQIKV